MKFVMQHLGAKRLEEEVAMLKGGAGRGRWERGWVERYWVWAPWTYL